MLNHFDTPVVLRTITRTLNANGYPVERESTSEIWGDLRSATRNEFYAAEAQGHKVSYVLTVPAVDWDGSEKVSIDGKLYSVVRTYQKTLDYIDLTLERI